MGRIWTPLSSVRTKPRFNPSYERRWFTFVASWLSAAGASTGQGSAQRYLDSSVKRKKRIFGPSREHAYLDSSVKRKNETEVQPVV